MYALKNIFLMGKIFLFFIFILAMDVSTKGRAMDKFSSMKKSALWSLLWITLALAFDGLLWIYFLHTGNRAVADNKAMAFLSGYLLEKTLAVDNVFVWLMIFNSFSIPLFLQQRLLTWGIFGAIGLRAVMIFGGIWLINKFRWLFYLFGAFLLFTGIKMILVRNRKRDIRNKPIAQWLQKHLRVTCKLHGTYFFVRYNGFLFATPLLLALAMVEFSDILFSFDSIPAIFSVTTDPFIVLTSNLFAILGLRAIYFLLAEVAERFFLLKYGLAVILSLIGIKMLFVNIIHIPVGISFIVVITTLSITLLLNAWINHANIILKK